MATIPINDVSPRNSYTASAGQTVFPYTFWISKAEDIDVFKNGVHLTLNVDYTVSGALDTDGGDVTLLVGAALNDSIVIARDIPKDRISEFQEAGNFKATVLNLELSKIIAMLQDQQLVLDRALFAPVELNVASGGFKLPLPTDGKTLVWDGAAGAMRNSVVNVDDIDTAVADAESAQTAAELAQTNAEAAQAAAETALDNFDDRYLGAKASDPTLDNDGDALITGALYFNTTDNVLKAYDGADWQSAGLVDNSVTLAKLAGGEAFTTLGFDSNGDPTEVFMGDGLIRDSTTMAINKHSQAEAEAGTDNTKVMTALRTKQAIDANAPAVQIVAAGRFNPSTGATISAHNLSLTRNSAGDYSASFGTAEPDANYMVQVANSGSGVTEYDAFVNRAGNNASEAPTTSGFRFVFINNGGNTLGDPDYVYVTVTRVV